VKATRLAKISDQTDLSALLMDGIAGAQQPDSQAINGVDMILHASHGHQMQWARVFLCWPKELPTRQAANCFWHPLPSPSDYIRYNTVTAKGPANDLTYEAQWPIMSYMPPKKKLINFTI
jgi:hypothetical protein